MDRKARVGVDEVVDFIKLIEAEMAEQETWESSIPAWHPRNDGSDSEDDAGDNGDDVVTDDANDDDDTDEDAGKTPEQIAIDKAHEKLRASETRERVATAKVKKLERGGMEENERLKAELADAQAETASLTTRLDRIELTGKATSIAKTLKFRNPEKAAAKFVGSDVTDEKGAKAALKEAAADFPELLGEAAPPPPVGEGKDNNGSGNSRMNSALRRAAGRAG